VTTARPSRREILGGLLAVAGLAACGGSGTTGSPSTAPATEAPRRSSTASTDAPPPAPSAAASSAPVAAAPSSGAGRPALFVPHGPRTQRAVALTFHASGDAALVSRLLDVLQEAGTPVTVFVVGQWLAAQPALGARLQRLGFELGNHTQTHQAMGSLAAPSVAAEISECAETLRTQTGSISSWFRPSGIAVPTPVILEQAGRAGYPVSVGYDVDSLDFTDPGAAAVVANVRRAVQPGSIVSLHFGHRATIDAMPAILQHLDDHGLEPVTIGRLLA
jgi:peptidoglycan/xylan/chitin deacetylase (PgdA/CDA1 family)